MGPRELVEVDTRSGVSRIIGSGLYPLPVEDGRRVLFYRSDRSRGTVSVLSAMSRGVPPVVIDIAKGPAAQNPKEGWADFVSRPVAIDSGRVVFAGENRDLWTLVLDTGDLRDIGQYTCLPLAWLPGPKMLMCRVGPEGEIVMLDLKSQRRVPRPKLDDIVGWAVVGLGDSLLVTLHPSMPMAEWYDLDCYDVTGDRLELVQGGLTMSRGGVWRPGVNLAP
jgi:hypothetical protein